MTGAVAVMVWLVLLLPCLSGVAVGYYSHDLDAGSVYSDALMQDLYKRLADIDPSYFLGRQDLTAAGAAPISDDVDEYDSVAPAWIDDDAASQLQSRPRSAVAGGQTDTRDSEYIGHSSNAATDGFIYMSGGAGEGKQHLTPSGSLKNVHQVKSDEALPFYCHPPNPCPKGYTGEDGCQELIEDTANMQKAWIEKMMSRGLCSCDEEHMFDCRASDRADDVDVKASDVEQQAFDDVLDRILGEKHDSVDNPYVGGQKRQTLVAKKSPRVKRAEPDDRIEQELDKLTAKRNENPYLKGTKLHTVAKKGFPGKQ